MDVEEIPVAMIEREAAPVVGQGSTTISPPLDVRKFCFSPDSDTESTNAVKNRASDLNDVLAKEDEAQENESNMGESASPTIESTEVSYSDLPDLVNSSWTGSDSSFEQDVDLGFIASPRASTPAEQDEPQPIEMAEFRSLTPLLRHQAAVSPVFEDFSGNII